MTENTTQNARGEWVPSIPVPFFSLVPWFRCPDCREGYWTRKGYKGHYSWVHVLGKP